MSTHRSALLPTLLLALALGTCAADPLPPGAPPSVAVFFEWGGTTLPPEAMATVRRTAERFKAAGGGRIVVSGHGDAPSGGIDLSRRRVQAVARALVAEGVPADRITTRDMGRADQLASGEDGARQPENRRVEIAIVPGTGPGTGQGLGPGSGTSR